MSSVVVLICYRLVSILFFFAQLLEQKLARRMIVGKKALIRLICILQFTGILAYHNCVRIGKNIDSRFLARCLPRERRFRRLLCFFFSKQVGLAVLELFCEMLYEYQS